MFFIFYSVYCAWCGKHISGPKTSNPDDITHGICADCHQKQLEEIDKLKK